MSINNTINSLGQELNKLFQRIERLKGENQMLLRKNQELEAQLKLTSYEQGDTGEKLVQYLDQLKNINQEGTRSEEEKKTEQTEGNIPEINPDNNFI